MHDYGYALIRPLGSGLLPGEAKEAVDTLFEYALYYHTCNQEPNIYNPDGSVW